MAAADYPEIVRRHFLAPANVGPIRAGAGEWLVHGEASAAGSGVRVLVQAVMCGGCISRLAFRAFGCPYLIAACSRATEMLTGKPPVALTTLPLQRLVEELSIPPEKLGSLLILEDALRNCFRDWDTTQPAAPR